MAEAVISKPFTFQVLFLDEFNIPIPVDDPIINIFQFSGSGVKQPLVSDQPMNPVVPAEVGRYTYTYTLPGTLTDGDTLYGEMRGEDPVTGLSLFATEELTAIASTRAGGGGYTGLIARFVKGG